MQVNQTWRDELAAGVDLLCAAALELAERHDPTCLDTHIRAIQWTAGAIRQQRASDHQIEVLAHVRSRPRVTTLASDWIASLHRKASSEAPIWCAPKLVPQSANRGGRFSMKADTASACCGVFTASA